MMEGLVWASLLSLLVKRRIGFSAQKITGIELSTFMIAKNTQSWFYLFMESVTKNLLSKLKEAWEKAVNFLSKYAKRANPDRDKKTGRLQYGLNSLA